MVAAKPDYGELFLGLAWPRVPTSDPEWIPKDKAWIAMLGLIGAVIMPHNLYLHSALVLTRKIN